MVRTINISLVRSSLNLSSWIRIQYGMNKWIRKHKMLFYGHLISTCNYYPVSSILSISVQLSWFAFVELSAGQISQYLYESVLYVWHGGDTTTDINFWWMGLQLNLPVHLWIAVNSRYRASWCLYDDKQDLQWKKE